MGQSFERPGCSIADSMAPARMATRSRLASALKPEMRLPRGRALAALRRAQERAKARGLGGLSSKEIDTEIKAVRDTRSQRVAARTVSIARNIRRGKPSGR